MIDPGFLELLACPRCHASLVEKGETLQCTDAASCGLIYRIDDGIPILLVDEATDPRTGAKSTLPMPSAMPGHRPAKGRP